MNKFDLEAIPGPLTWRNRPTAWQHESGNRLMIEAGAETDWFADPAGSQLRDNAPAALFVPAGDNFTLSAHIAVEFASTFDAGVLQLRASEALWAKLCFEFSPQRRPMIVSVVTRGLSDDCNSEPVEEQNVFLRVARMGKTFAFHFSRDGRLWHLVRYFTLGEVKDLQVGFSSQSPTGRGCRTIFSEIAFEEKLIEDIRSGE